jgi:hypothetical protein
MLKYLGTAVAHENYFDTQAKAKVKVKCKVVPVLN